MCGLVFGEGQALAYNISVRLTVAPSTTSPCVVLALGELLSKAENPAKACVECSVGGGVALPGLAALAEKSGSASVWKSLHKVMSQYLDATDRSAFMSAALLGAGMQTTSDIFLGSSDRLVEDIVEFLAGERRASPERAVGARAAPAPSLGCWCRRRSTPSLSC